MSDSELSNNKHLLVPTRIIGPIKILSNLNNFIEENIKVPMSTFETSLWHSASRGAKLSRLTSGIKVNVIDDNMTRSILLETKSLEDSYKLKLELINRKKDIDEVISKTSHYAKLIDMHFEFVGTLVFIRFKFTTGNASGHNMVTKSANAVAEWIIENYKNIDYVSVSGNICVDKKVSAINSILGRGKNVTAEIVIPKTLCEEILHTTPEAIVNINTKKNLIGSILAGSICSANAHYANMLLACFLATGQDAGNIIEGSQGITFCKVLQDGSLYFSVNCPNIIVGTIGHGKDLNYTKNNLELMGCLNNEESSKKLAGIIVATVLCGELSLLAAQVHGGSFVKAQERIERKKRV
ncbi:MAG TPA: hypothetical protein VLL98_02965 [Rickettsiales bacterium]|nr:hypothetical protein [Rickettsiales bacterium]